MRSSSALPDQKSEADEDAAACSETAAATEPEREMGGPSGPEPTRYGDWERKGRCFDF